MLRRCALEVLDKAIGEWTTVREELADVIKETIDKSGMDVSSYDICSDGDGFIVWMEDEEGVEAEIIIDVEKAGSTWYITNVR